MKNIILLSVVVLSFSIIWFFFVSLHKSKWKFEIRHPFYLYLILSLLNSSFKPFWCRQRVRKKSLLAQNLATKINFCYGVTLQFYVYIIFEPIFRACNKVVKDDTWQNIIIFIISQNDRQIMNLFCKLEGSSFNNCFYIRSTIRLINDG